MAGRAQQVRHRRRVRDLPIRTRLLGAFLAVAALVAVVAVFGIGRLGAMHDELVGFDENGLRPTVALLEAKEDVAQLRIRFLAHVNATDPDRKEELEAELATLVGEID